MRAPSLTPYSARQWMKIALQNEQNKAIRNFGPSLSSPLLRVTYSYRFFVVFFNIFILLRKTKTLTSTTFVCVSAKFQNGFWKHVVTFFQCAITLGAQNAPGIRTKLGSQTSRYNLRAPSLTARGGFSQARVPGRTSTNVFSRNIAYQSLLHTQILLRAISTISTHIMLF